MYFVSDRIAVLIFVDRPAKFDCKRSSSKADTEPLVHGYNLS